MGSIFFFKHSCNECFFLICIYLWLCWVFVPVRGLSLAAASGGHSSSRCAGLSPQRPLPLQSTGSRRAGSATVAHGPSRSVACRILPDQGSNPHPLHWQADSQPLRHQGSPECFLIGYFNSFILYKVITYKEGLLPFCCLFSVCFISLLFLISYIIAFFCV